MKMKRRKRRKKKRRLKAKAIRVTKENRLLLIPLTMCLRKNPKQKKIPSLKSQLMMTPILCQAYLANIHLG